VTEFADIAAFARQHAACGGITPNATTPVGGGYLLTLTCACGATMDRWITAEEARDPLPIAPRSEAPPATASPDLEAALQDAIAADGINDGVDSTVLEQAGDSPSQDSASEPALAPSPELEAILRDALAAEADAEPAASVEPPPARAPSAVAPPAPRNAVEARVPSPDLEAALRAAIAADEPAAPPRPAPRPAVERTELGNTVRDALAAQRALRVEPPAPRPGVRGFWIVVILLSTVALGLAAWIGLGGLEIPAPGTPAPSAATTAAASTPAIGARAATTEVVQGLRQLQSASNPNTGFNVYANRVLFVKADLDRFLKSEAGAEVKGQAREIVELHVLAAAAWRARDLDRKETWEALGQDPAIDLCPSVKRVVDFADSRGDQSRAQARGVALGGAIPLLWECAAGRLTKLEETRG
jgi:hypothetical protein